MAGVGFTDKDQGLAYLVEVISAIARRALKCSAPDVAAAIAACNDPEEAARLAAEGGLTTEAVPVLNEALCLEIGLERLTNALRVAQLPPDLRSHSVSMLAEDTLSIALSASVDAVRRTLECAYSTYVVDENKEARTLRLGWRAWTKSAKAQLSPTRQPVAHAETLHTSEFADLKIWEGSILLGVGGHELLRSVADDRSRASHEALERRVEPLRKTAILLVAKVFAECGALAALIEHQQFSE